MTAIQFDEKEHKYYVEDKNVPGISEILKTVKLTRDYAGVSPYYRERGILVHECIEADLAGDLDFDALSPALKPFVSAWRDFVKLNKYVSVLCEEIQYSETEEFACRIDHLGYVKGVKTVFDVKCSNNHDPAADWQVCGQAFALHDNEYRFWNQAVLELHDDGTYAWFPAPVDLEVWPAIMKLYRRKCMTSKKH